jgi:hypothetical protein
MGYSGVSMEPRSKLSYSVDSMQRTRAETLNAFRVVACLVSLLVTATACQSSKLLQPVAPSETIHCADGDFTLTPMMGGWVREVVEPGDENALGRLVLHHQSAGLQVIVHVHEGAADSLDSVVLSRRRLIAENWRIIEQTEERSFLPRALHVPMSRIEYQVIDYDGTWIPIQVGVVRGKAAVIELLALGGSAPTNTELFSDLMSGFRFTSAELARP